MVADSVARDPHYVVACYTCHVCHSHRAHVGALRSGKLAVFNADRVCAAYGEVHLRFVGVLGVVVDEFAVCNLDAVCCHRRASDCRHLVVFKCAVVNVECGAVAADGKCASSRHFAVVVAECAVRHCKSGA